MRFDQAFALSSILLASVAFASLVFAKSLPLGLALPAAMILLVSLLQAGGVDAVRRITSRLVISPILWNLLLISTFVMFVIDLTLLSRDLLQAGIHFLVLLLSMKVCTLRQRRDYRQLYAISLMAILAAASLTTNAWYLPIFLLFLLVAVWTLLLYHLTLEGSDPSPVQPTGAQMSNVAAGHARVTARFVWLTNGITLLAITLTFAIFFLIPRIGVGVLQKKNGDVVRTTGFSDRVDLGTIGSVKQNPQVVMRVELPDQQNIDKDRFYVRGLAYDRYNGRSWSQSRTRRRALNLVEDGTFLVRPPGSRSPARSSANRIRQDILLEPLDTAVVFAASFAEVVNGEFYTVQADSMSGLYLLSPPSSRIRYSVTSQMSQLTAEEQTATSFEYADPIRARYLQVPDGSQQIGDLTQQVTAQALTPFGRVQAIQQHLMNNYRYSLEADTATLSHPLEEFLFTRKTGYCEHYATAMVVMLRTIGIPARLVTGFLATEWNEYGGYFTVRQRDAHAWVEVYFPRSGWITMDPTPSVNAAVAPSRWARLSRLGESIQLQWDRLFVRYSAKDQLAVVHGVREGSDALRETISRWMARLGAPIGEAASRMVRMAKAFQPGIVGLVAGSLVIGIAVLLLTLRDRIGLWATTHLPSAHPQLAILQLYARMLRVLERRGIRKAPAVTAGEFARYVAQEWQTAGPAVAEITTLYNQGRFSKTPLSAEELSRAAEQVGQLQSLARSTP